MPKYKTLKSFVDALAAGEVHNGVDFVMAFAKAFGLKGDVS